MLNLAAPAAKTRPRQLQTLGVTGCANCRLIRQCGGDPLPLIYALGCVNGASPPAGDIDDMNPVFEERFWQLWDDVNGLEDFSTPKLLSVSGSVLPRYIPRVQHPYMPCSRPLDVPVVALGLFDVLGRRAGGIYGPRCASASALRSAYKLGRDTQILLVGVDDDEPLEEFWAEHRVNGTIGSLVDLELLGATVPNFSFFTDVPRFQVLRNRKRILLSAERISNAGVRVSPHINANTDADWDFWLQFLQEHPEIETVTMEFQTGARADEDIGRQAFDQLVRLMDSLGRPLHPFLVGAARYYREAQANFDSFSVIDSKPFMATMARRMLTRDPDGRYSWKSSPTLEDEPLQDLFESNLLLYPDKIDSDPDEGCERPQPNPDQLEMNLFASTPYLGAQPQARGTSAINSGAVSSCQR